MNLVNIIIMFIVLCILASLAYNFFGVRVRHNIENFTFCSPDDCSCVCNRLSYKTSCSSPYLKDGPASLCDCKWNSKTLQCDGTRAHGTRCAL